MTTLPSQRPREQITPPGRSWTDWIARRLRANSIAAGPYAWISRRLVPMLFAFFVAAPIGLLILPFFIPKFIRNARRRRKYEVRLSPDRRERI
jgi:hypothetical protein